ncbi:unnamed protein product [Urochloa humidicola]
MRSSRVSSAFFATAVQIHHRRRLQVPTSPSPVQIDEPQIQILESTPTSLGILECVVLSCRWVVDLWMSNYVVYCHRSLCILKQRRRRFRCGHHCSGARLELQQGESQF